jgi:hypothetical protein
MRRVGCRERHRTLEHATGWKIADANSAAAATAPSFMRKGIKNKRTMSEQNLRY